MKITLKCCVSLSSGEVLLSLIRGSKGLKLLGLILLLY